MSLAKFLHHTFSFDKRDTLFLAVTVWIFVMLRLPSLIEPYWYGDEGIYQVIGIALRQGRMLYEGAWDNKPPLLYLIYALFNGDQFSVRFASLIVGMMTVIAFFLLSKALLSSVRAIFVSTVIFAVMFGLPIIEGNIANAENFMLLPIICALYCMVYFLHKQSIWYAVSSGILLSFAFLIKSVAIFDFAAILTIIFAIRYYEGTLSVDHPSLVGLRLLFSHKVFVKLAHFFKEESIFVISFFVPILLSLIVFLLMGGLGNYVKAAFMQNVGYVGVENFFLFPMGLLLVKTILLVFGVFLILRYSKRFDISGIVIYTWLLFSLFSSLFSARPYTHYLLVLLPAFALFVGYIFEKKNLLSFNLLLLFLLIVLINNNFGFYKKIIPYYSNYFAFVAGTKSFEDYQSFFDSITPRDYKIASFLRANTTAEDSVFLWSDSGQIYALSGKLPPGRYIVAYHITSYPEAISETKKALDVSRPKFIVDTKGGKTLEEFTSGYSHKYTIDNAKIYEREF